MEAIIIPILRRQIREALAQAELHTEWESELYTLGNHVLFSITVLAHIKTEGGALLVQSQRTLVPHDLPVGTKARQFLIIDPDISLLLSVNDGRTRQPGPYLEFKRAFPDTNKPFPFLSSDAVANHDIKFETYRTQILWQGFCSMNVFPEKLFSFVFFIVGIRFSTFKFKKPTDLKPVPRDLTESGSITTEDFWITDLLSKGDIPEILVANECIFAVKDGGRELANPLQFSDAFTFAIRISLPEGVTLPKSTLFPVDEGFVFEGGKKELKERFTKDFEKLYLISENTKKALRKSTPPPEAGPFYESPIQHHDPDKKLPVSPPSSPPYTPTPKHIGKGIGRIRKLGGPGLDRLNAFELADDEGRVLKKPKPNA
ncbi:hypothetical protein VKT23_020595 [Stygiomarasmius scandens]|uniref:Uncharacterized protein n=1 Tax=Marasmiellus scandens TaxID=2682957 RepID=A0ABR1IJZ8_9AGAR